MIVIRKVRGPSSYLPESKIKIVCLHELTLQTIRKYAHLNLTSYPFTTSNPQIVIDFLTQNYEILSSPYSSAQDKVVQAVSLIINHTNSLELIETNIGLFSKIIHHFHQNLNYNIILDCTVFKTPNNYLYPRPITQTTYFLIIQLKSITGDVSLIKNFSNITRRKSSNYSISIYIYSRNEFWCDRAMIIGTQMECPKLRNTNRLIIAVENFLFFR